MMSDVASTNVNRPSTSNGSFRSSGSESGVIAPVPLPLPDIIAPPFGASHLWSEFRDGESSQSAPNWPSPFSSERQRYQHATELCGLHFAPIFFTSFGTGRFRLRYAFLMA